MALDSRVNIFTTAMRAEFQKAYEAVAEPAPWEKFTQVIPSTARIEHYTWMSPSPGVGEYKGHRRYGKIDSVRYTVENKEFDSSFSVLLRDIEDDQTGGYMLKPKELAERAKRFPGRWVLKHLAAATTRTCFDGSTMIANSHTIGTGDNNLAAITGTGNSDGNTYKLFALYTGGPLKPLMWQNRKGPVFETNAGTPQSKEAKVVNYWIDMEGEAAYGWWWDMVYQPFTNLPSVAQVQEAFGLMTAAFRSFQLPKSAASEDGERIHEQTVFGQSNLWFVGSTALERLLAQALGEMFIPQNIGNNTVATTNLYRGFASSCVSAFLDP